MLGVICCDDDRFMLDMSVKMARRCIKENGLDANLVCATTDYREALRFIEKNPSAYLYFLDIDFGKSSLNGVDIAKVIKKAEPRSKIVFVTSHADMGMSVLKSGVEAFGFIEKAANESKMFIGYKKYISLALENAALTVGNTSNDGYIQLLVGIDEYVSLPVSQILYVEADKSVSHFVCYHTVDGSSVSVRDTIENVLNILGGNFIKSHRSVIINKNYVVSVADGLVKFAGGETAACSFRLKNDIIRKCGVKKA
ncbi:MAG: LytTR family DNA-binding domain-containing protein [Clostridiales bacterium]|jgi:DNA-binding LytR/AlgR family response regulator|nr:LytTR family DNA-binding domain-containing protein [Clostridiales bacterium]